MKIQNNNKRKNNSKTSKNNTNSGESKNIDENITVPQDEKDNRLPKAYMEPMVNIFHFDFTKKKFPFYYVQ